MTANEKKKKAALHFQKAYGRFNSTELSRETMEVLKAEARKTGGSHTIDDITWHDLDMDRLFTAIDTTASSCGDGMLYRRLRHPDGEEKRLRDFEAMTDAFYEDPDMRLAAQSDLSAIGREKDVPVIKRIRDIDRAKEIGSLPYILLALITLIDIVCFFFIPMIAILAFIPIAAINVIMTLKTNDRTGAASEGFRAVLAMVRAGEDLLSDKVRLPEMKQKKLSACVKAFSGFRRGAFFVTSRSAYSEGLGEAALQYLKLFFHVDLIKFDAMLRAYRGHEEEARELYDILGDIDCACSAASLKKALTISCRPHFLKAEEGACLKMTDMGHPLIADPVRQTFEMRGGQLITGSNASGKSTFLKNTAISVILAQALGISPSSSYEAPVFRVMTSMALSDDLMAGESYFVVEIRSLKRILDAAKEKKPLLCIIDEVLRGTNTIERIASSARILKELTVGHVLPLAATHDIELSYILEGFYTNRHFTEEIRENDISFPYKLLDGRASTRNAIRLLEHFGYEEEICRDAAVMAERFEEKGEWKLEG